MTTLQSISAAVNWHIRTNENFAAASPAALFAQKASTTTGLTLGYYGGILDGVSYADGTHLLTASTNRYVVAARATGVVSSATGTTNWNDQTNYLRMGVAVVGASTITSWTDWRQAYGGAGGAGAGVAGSDKQIQYNNGGSFGAEAGFEYDQTSNTLTVANCTYTGLALTAASATGGAGLRLPHGAAPTSPTNGDLWTTTAGLYARINGATVGPYASTAGTLTNPMTTAGDVIVGGSAGAPVRLAIGTNTSDVLGVASGTPAWVKRTPLIIPIACGDETTAMTTGTAKVTFRMPCAMTLSTIPRMSLTTAGTGATLVQVNIKKNGTTIFSTNLTTDASEKTSTTAATAAVLTSSPTNFADDDEVTIDIVAVGSTVAGTGLKVYLIGYPT
jgi:hypothetical protein